MWYKKGNLEILHVGLNIKLALYQHKHFQPRDNRNRWL